MTRKVKTHSIEHQKINCMRNSLSGSLPPPLGHPQFAMVLMLPGLVISQGGPLMTSDVIVPSFGGADY